MNYQIMSDYDLCKYKHERGAIEELWNRYNKFIYKNAYRFYKKIRGRIDIDDIIQEYAIIFYKAIEKIDYSKITDEEYFITKYVPFYFQGYQRYIFHKYSYELDYTHYDYFGHNYIKLNSNLENDDYNILSLELEDTKENSNPENNFQYLLDTIRNILTEKEFDMIYKVIILNYMKKDVATYYKISPNLFHHHFEKILDKLRYYLKDEKDYLSAS